MCAQLLWARECTTVGLHVVHIEVAVLLETDLSGRWDLAV